MKKIYSDGYDIDFLEAKRIYMTTQSKKSLST